MTERATNCRKCDGCRHQHLGQKKDYCYMFDVAPDTLPCPQHDRFAAERKVMGRLISGLLRRDDA